jgi:hypothetical protein
MAHEKRNKFELLEVGRGFAALLAPPTPTTETIPAHFQR